MKQLLILLTILSVPFFEAAAQRVFNLKQCIETGLERNYSIRIVRNEQLINENNVTLGNAGYLPTFDLSGGGVAEPSITTMKEIVKPATLKRETVSGMKR